MNYWLKHSKKIKEPKWIQAPKSFNKYSAILYRFYIIGILWYFSIYKNGLFIEAGAADCNAATSHTLDLEQKYNWTGIFKHTEYKIGNSIVGCWSLNMFHFNLVKMSILTLFSSGQVQEYF